MDRIHTLGHLQELGQDPVELVGFSMFAMCAAFGMLLLFFLVRHAGQYVPGLR